MPILKRLKEEAGKVKRGFHLTTGIGLHGKEKEKFERLKAERKKVKYERDLASYKRQAEIESLKTRIHKTKEARIKRQPTGRRRMGIMETPSMFLDNFSPVGFYGRQPKPSKTKKVKKRRKKTKKKRRRITEYY